MKNRYKRYIMYDEFITETKDNLAVCLEGKYRNSDSNTICEQWIQNKTGIVVRRENKRHIYREC